MIVSADINTFSGRKLEKLKGVSRLWIAAALYFYQNTEKKFWCKNKYSVINDSLELTLTSERWMSSVLKVLKLFAKYILSSLACTSLMSGGVGVTN